MVLQKLKVVAFVALSLAPLSYFANGIYVKYIRQKEIPNVTQSIGQGFPVRLTIPAIDVDASVQYVGVASDGNMEVPDNTDNVGWFKLGYRPGEMGSAVVSGHFNGKNGEPAVFYNLYKLKKGDKMYLKNDKGTTITFVVRESRTYNPGYAEEIFSPNDGVYLNLVTCDGVWDGTKKSYSKRLVVFADIYENPK